MVHSLFVDFSSFFVKIFHWGQFQVSFFRTLPFKLFLLKKKHTNLFFNTDSTRARNIESSWVCYCWPIAFSVPVSACLHNIFICHYFDTILILVLRYESSVRGWLTSRPNDFWPKFKFGPFAQTLWHQTHTRFMLSQMVDRQQNATTPVDPIQKRVYQWGINIM